MTEIQETEQAPYLVFGGELKDLTSKEFRDPNNMEIVGIFPNYMSAQAAWKARAQATVDNALQCYCIVDLNLLLNSQCFAASAARQQLS